MLKHLTIPEIENISALAERAARRDSDEPLDWHANNHVDRIYEYRRRQTPLIDAIARLSFEARMELMALMWIGRGDGFTFEGALQHARRTTSESDAAYMAGKSPLPRYLRRGLERIGLGRDGRARRPAA